MTTVDGRALTAANDGLPRRLVGVAVVGVGLIGPHHVDAVRRGGYGEVRALVGSDQARTDRRAAELGVPRSTDDLDAVLAMSDIEVVHICTPNDSHVELARRALEAGKHIVVEKPLGNEIAVAQELEQLAVRLERHAMVAFTYRGYPMVRRARRIIQAGEAGELRLIHARYVQDWLASSSDYNWRVDQARGGRSRAVADIGSHIFDTIEWISGTVVESVAADLATFVSVRQNGSQPVQVESEDVGTILVRLANGGRGTFAVSQISPGRKNSFKFDIAGSSRSLAWDQEQPDILWSGTRDRSELLQRMPSDGQSAPGIPALPDGHPEGWSGAMRDLLRPFYAAVVGADTATRDSYPTLGDGIRAMWFVEAVLRSAQEGVWVDLPVQA